MGMVTNNPAMKVLRILRFNSINKGHSRWLMEMRSQNATYFQYYKDNLREGKR